MEGGDVKPIPAPKSAGNQMALPWSDFFVLAQTPLWILKPV